MNDTTETTLAERKETMIFGLSVACGVVGILLLLLGDDTFYKQTKMSARVFEYSAGFFFILVAGILCVPVSRMRDSRS
jgi:hypothetical protein